MTVIIKKYISNKFIFLIILKSKLVLFRLVLSKEINICELKKREIPELNFSFVIFVISSSCPLPSNLQKLKFVFF